MDNRQQNRMIVIPAHHDSVYAEDEVEYAFIPVSHN
jgi:hypothetical protein